MSMEKLSLRKTALLSAGALSIILGACSTDQETSDKTTPQFSATVAPHTCRHTEVNVLPGTKTKIDTQIITPSDGDPWQTAYGIQVLDKQAHVSQFSIAGDKKHPKLVPTGESQIFDIENDNSVSFTDESSGTIIRVSSVDQVAPMPKISFDVSFCPPKS